jgi:hypothetical protein
MISSVLKTAILCSQMYTASGLLLRPMIAKLQANKSMSSGKPNSMAMDAADCKLVPVTILTVMIPVFSLDIFVMSMKQ